MEHLLFKATLAAAVLTFLIILFTRKENNYLSAAGGDTKKLMVVDQTTGAITFLNNSVQGINDQFTNSDATQTALLKTLFGDNLDGAGGTFKTKMDELLLSRDTKIATLEGHKTAEWKAFVKGNGGAGLRGMLDNSIPSGHRIKIESEHGTGKWKMLADQACDHNLSATGDGGDGEAYSADGAAWCASVKVHPMHRIVKVT